MTNLFIGKGNLGNHPVLSQVTHKDTTFVTTSMRVFFGRYGKDANGEITQVGGFWREVVLYGDKAKACAQWLRKGARVLVSGEEKEFIGKDDHGNKVQVIKIEADDVALILSRIESLTFIQRESEASEASSQSDSAVPA